MIWNLEKYKDRTALICETGVTVSYEKLNKIGKEIADTCGGRCLVFVMCQNTLGSVLGYTAFTSNGIVSVLLNAHMDRQLLDNLIETYKPAYIWAPAEVKTDYAAFGNTECPAYMVYDYVLIKTGFEVSYPLHDDLCLMLTTSGSTGSPKFVRQSYTNVEYNARSIVQYLELNATERPITTLPMNYTYGLSIINSHLLVGATILLTDKGVMQKEFWRFFREENATSFGGVPYTYEMLDRLRFYRMDLPSLRYMTQAGGKLTPELHKKFAEYANQTGKKFIVMYGQCEATARMGYLPAEKSLEKCGSMGIAIPGGKFHLIDVNGMDIITPNITGELVYEGKNVTMGYAEKGEDLILGDERNGILETGDMAQFDTDGFYYIVGRKKRFLKIYGNRVNLDEIDCLIKTHFDIIDVASTGVDDHMYIFVTDKEIASDVKQFVTEKTKLNSAAFKTFVIDEIPKNDSGKILYKELAKYYE